MTLTDLDIETAAARETRSPENRKSSEFHSIVDIFESANIVFF